MTSSSASPAQRLPPRAPPQVGNVAALAEDALRLRNCQFVVDGVHPKCGAVYLFYCAPKDLSLSPFYVALCDERSRNKKGPVGRKTLDVVRRIQDVVIQRKVLRDERFTFLGSAPASRSTSCSTAAEDPLSAHDEQPWAEVLLALCDEATGATVGDDVHSFTQECQRLSHDADDVRRLYQWTACTSGILPLHLSLRQLELTAIEGNDGANQGDEVFVAYCDPLLLPKPSKPLTADASAAISAASSTYGGDEDRTPTAAAITPRRKVPLGGQDGGDVLSPMTPAAGAASPFTAAVEDKQATVFAAYFGRADRVLSITHRALRTPPPAPQEISPLPLRAAAKYIHSAAQQSPLKTLQTSHVKPQRWDSTYL